TIQIDSAGISILKQTQGASQELTSRRESIIGLKDLAYTYEVVSSKEHKTNHNLCVFIDIGKRDLPYCANENFTVNRPR
ncbi:hypothetical protein J3Q64DRAFT_1644820, partial [Phycomyces blakesleeanus]